MNGKIIKIYLDNCCYNRPYDDQSQDRIHDESEAILSIIHRCRNEKTVIVGSKVLELEMSLIQDVSRRYNVSMLYSVAKNCIEYSDKILERAKEIQQFTNIKNMDSLHIASAESEDVDVFLTTDDRLIKAMKKFDTRMKVMNPVSYLAEVIENDE